ncbi:MAG: fibronectin type III domain-containing protein, partial [Psychrosphaera sp.]|nr:fibronectin type III domain-containing protein [Psychrosphaera sp.]
MAKYWFILSSILMSSISFAASISGTVRGDGAPLLDATVVLLDSNKNELSRLQTVSNGLYKFDNLPLNTYFIDVEPTNNGYAGSFNNEIRVLEDIDYQLDLNMQRAVELFMLTGEFKSTDGYPIKGITISYRGITQYQQDTTDSKGHWQASQLVPAQDDFSFVVYGTYTKTYLVTLDEDIMIPLSADLGGLGMDGINITPLDKDIHHEHPPLQLVILRGRVVDANGIGVVGAKVLIRGCIRNEGEGCSNENSIGFGNYMSGELAVGETGKFIMAVNPNLRFDFAVKLNGFLDLVTNDIEIGKNTILINALNIKDEIRPSIQVGPFIRRSSETTAVIELFTDEPSYTVVSVDGVELRSESLRTHHNIIVEELVKNSFYTASVYVEDASGNRSLTEQVTFNTLAEIDDQMPSFTITPTITQAAHNTATLIFGSDEAVSTKVIVFKGDEIVTSITLADYALEHQIVIPDLFAITDYTAVVEITDGEGNGPVKSVPLAFSTTISGDVTPPRVISGPAFKNIKNGQATVIWETDEPTLTAVSYNDGEHYGVHRSEDYRRFHTVTLDNLIANTLYKITVSATDAYGNGPTLTEITDFYTLDTADSDPPTMIGELGISQLGDSEAMIQWLTDEPSSAVVLYGETAEALTMQTSAAVPKTFHRVPLTQLKSDQTYFYQVITTDTTGNSATSAVQSFTTKSAGQAAPLTYVEIPQVLQVTDTSMTFGIRTNRAATSQIACKSETGDVHQIATNGSAKQQQVILAGLTAGFNYACS